jgi:hypothetical protein
MTRLSDIDRRTYLQGLCGGTALVGGAAFAVGAVSEGKGNGEGESKEKGEGSNDSADADEDRPNPEARPVVWDVSGSMGFESHMHYEGDPANPPADDQNGSKEHRDGRNKEEEHDRQARDWVVHVTSDSETTRDYAAGLVNLRRRVGIDVSLDIVSDGNLSYDYYWGPDHEAGAPDEILLVLQTPAQADEGKGHALVKHVDDGHDAPDTRAGGEWRTTNVDDEMSSGNWRAVEIHADPDELRVSDHEIAGDVLQRLREDLQEQETIDNLFDEYPEDTELVGVGFGVGSLQDEVAVDIYYDDLFVDVVPEVASITFNDQQVGRGQNQSVRVAQVAYPEPGGYIDIHDPNDTEDMPLGAIQGAFDEYLEPGLFQNIQVGLFEDFNCHEFEQDQLQESKELMAMPHIDEPNDEEYTHFCGHGEGPPDDGGFFDPPDGEFPEDIVDDTGFVRVGSEQGRGDQQGRNNGQNPNRGQGRGREENDPPERGRRHSPGLTFDFPAALPMDLEFDPQSVERDEETRAKLRFTQDEMDIDRNNLIRDSITLFPYTEAAPPVEDGLDAPPEDVIFKEGGYDVTFTGGDIADLDRLGTGDAFVLVAGQLDYEQVVWFLGTAELTIRE